MTVQVKSSNAIGRAIGPTDYSETFLRGDEPFTLGNNWFDCFSSSATVTFSENLLGSQVNVSVAGVTFGGVANGIARVKFFPVPIDHQEVRRQALIRGLKAAMTFVGSTGGGTCDVGPMCFGEGYRGQEYCLNRANSGQVTLYSNLSDGSGGGGTLAANVFTIAAGDEFELRVTPGPSSNSIGYYKNGVLIGTYVDSAANRPTGGLYGIHFFGNGANTTATYKNYRGGVL